MVDKEVIQQILGILIKRPQYLNQVDKYKISLDDFSSSFEKYIFTAIHGLYFGGANNIQVIDIENYLSTNAKAKVVFDNNNGIEFLQDILDFAQVDNFDYYYDKLKKFNLLRDAKKQGFSTDSFYIEDGLTDRAMEINSKFEEISAEDIINNYKRRILALENEYATPEEVQTWIAADEIDEVIESFGTFEAIGMPVQGGIFNQVINGAELGALTVCSSGSGVGKTRTAAANACYLAFPIRYNTETFSWENKGSSEKVLFIITEQKKEQLIKMILAYLSGINESKFKLANFTPEERKRLQIAREIMVKYRDNFIMVRMPNPTIGLVKSLVREKCIMHDIKYMFFDYIFINPSLIDEFKGTRLRNDELLLMFTTALKDLAVELNISVFTSTQVNAQADNSTGIRNESTIAGSRSIINKADNGCVMARPSKEELEIIKDLDTGFEMPNLVFDIYKVRSGQWTQVRIWSYFDAGTMRKKDLFITDAMMNVIEDFYIDPKLEIENWDNEEKAQIIKYLGELNDRL